MGSKQDGYIKLFRSLKKWKWYSDTATVRVWIHILLTAAYKDTDTLGAGQIQYSAKSLADELGMQSTAVQTATRHLLETGEISVVAPGKSHNKTVYKVNKWDSYQFIKEEEKKTDKPKKTAKNDDKPWERVGLTKEQWEDARS